MKKNKELHKLLVSLQEDEEEKLVVKPKTPSGEDVTIEYVMKNVTNYEEFCEVTGMKYCHQSDFMSFINPKKICAQEKLNQIESFFNKDREIDWFNRSQRLHFMISIVFLLQKRLEDL